MQSDETPALQTSQLEFDPVLWSKRPGCEVVDSTPPLARNRIKFNHTTRDTRAPG
jgi:hypothetical protein